MKNAIRIGCALMLALAGPLRAQAVDSALVGRILAAEDRRDSNDPSLHTGLNSPNERIRVLAGRALARIRDDKFASRDSFPLLPAPPHYADPAWRLRYRALNKQTDCAALTAALADSVWSVRLRAVDLVGPSCSSDTGLMRTLQSWASAPPANNRRSRRGAGWQPSAHALLALSRVAPADAQRLLPRFASSPVPWLRTYAARAATTLSDTVQLRKLAADPHDNVKEAAIDGLAKIAGHSADDVIVAALSARGYQAVRAAARALKGSPRGREVLDASLNALRRIQLDSSETSRDTRAALRERITEFATNDRRDDVKAVSSDDVCDISERSLKAQSAERRQTRECPRRPTLPADAVALALGQTVDLRVTLADSSGGGSFVVRLRGDVAPIMAARILSLAQSGYYDGLTWQRVEPDFVIQGGSPGANEYVGYRRFLIDELGTVPHVRGTVGMSTRGHDTGDAQWFVNLRDNLRLNADYTVFGEVVEGIDVVDGVLEGDVIAHVRPIIRVSER